MKFRPSKINPMKRLFLCLLLLISIQVLAAPDDRDKLRSLQFQEAIRSGQMSTSEAQEMRQREDSLRKQRWQQKQENNYLNESPGNNRWRKEWKNGSKSHDD